MTNENGKRPLPEGWVWTTLGEATNPERERVHPQDFPHLPYIGMDDVTSQTMQLLGTKPASEMRSAAEHFRPDDVLYGSLRPYLNKVYRPDFEGLSSAEFIVFRRAPHLQSKYLQYFLNQWSFVEFINRQNTGDRPRVKFNQMAEYPVPLPPLPTQHRIVAEIEKQFTRLDAAVAALRRAKANLARYKAAVLKAAVEGRLVPRPQRSSETSEVLLARILAERRARWQAANPKKQYVEPKRPNVDGLPELPEGWVWANLEQLTWDSSYGTSQKCDYSASGPPVLRIPNIVKGYIDLSDLKYAIDSKDLSYDNFKWLAPGDIVVIRTNGSRNLIGRSALVRKSFNSPHYFASYLIRFRVVQISTLAEWINSIWNSDVIRRQIETTSATSAGQYNVSLSSLNQFVIPIPSQREQKRIIAELDRRLSIIQSTEQTLDANLARAERLRQAVLARAFRGELV